VTGALLDTNAFLQFGFESWRVTAQARAAVGGRPLFVSHVCAIEMAIKHSVGKLDLPPSYTPSFEHGFNETARELAATVLPIAVSHIAALARLPFHHRDPFDRLLICQGIVDDLAVVTRDGKFGLYAGLQVIQI
jgi:PIN domain nuclease of toxin-antitoxin system